jgi:alkanesulfonate monooxygenase SsuD/methylene tetrahydromethanopterin reductase-like flavin-dependent oxidoreductase (luciferase family)
VDRNLSPALTAQVSRMKFGAPLMPSHPPEWAIRDGQLQDLKDIEQLESLGFEEAWIGEHFTAAWEPCPAPDLLIAQPSRSRAGSRGRE